MTATAGKLIIISGPSGVGKSTLLQRVLARFPDRLRLSISATTRPPRQGEQDGKHYYFLSSDQFEEKRQAGEFIECCEVFGRGHWYGTLRSEVEPSLEAGKSVILEIDVDGTAHVLSQYPQALTIFVSPGPIEELERRLRQRGSESEESLRRRLEVALHEMQQAGKYEHQVINEKQQLQRAVDQIAQILKPHILTRNGDKA
jgi:guanylate kinase